MAALRVGLRGDEIELEDFDEGAVVGDLLHALERARLRPGLATVGCAECGLCCRDRMPILGGDFPALDRVVGVSREHLLREHLERPPLPDPVARASGIADIRRQLSLSLTDATLLYGVERRGAGRAQAVGGRLLPLALRAALYRVREPPSDLLVLPVQLWRAVVGPLFDSIIRRGVWHSYVALGWITLEVIVHNPFLSVADASDVTLHARHGGRAAPGAAGRCFIDNTGVPMAEAGSSTRPRGLRPNRVKERLAAGQVATVTGGVSTGDMIELIGVSKFDGYWIECEHGPTDFADIPDLARACDLWGMTSIVRVSQNRYDLIYRTLDVGPMGVVVPHVNTRDEARAVVEAAKFAPAGKRGMFGSRQSLGVTNFYERANDQSLVIILIEDIVATENLDAILTVDHIDVFFVATSDLAQSMGYVDASRLEVQEVAKAAWAKIRAAGKIGGAVVPKGGVAEAVRNGVRFVYVTWQPWLIAAARSYLDEVAQAT